uniref:alanine--tRNA ligase n=1 Tax=Angiostrongylus cantonensis TaxID=6313 RepID=A0A158P6S1_ANGCA
LNIRRSFIKYFEGRGHLHVPSSSVLPPPDDASLLFTNAGMNQFKSLFLGNSRAVSCQRCIRAGGKHNDLEDVGSDLHHLSFFEMLGNWSFNGAYSKEEAYNWAWYFLTDVLNINPDRLYVSYFGGSPRLNIAPDESSKHIWLEIGLPESHILPFSNENFWEMGSTGPCGPCSEIHYDRVHGRKHAGRFVNVDNSIVELWNIVFISYMRMSSGDLQPLPNNHIDTGMGLERLSSIVQDVPSNYDTDIFAPILRSISLGKYDGRVGSEDLDGHNASCRILADHLRSAVIALSDGVQLGSLLFGFLIRKMLRRSFWHSSVRLGIERFASSELVPVVIDTLKETYPELKRYEESIRNSVVEEERQYWSVVDKGKSIFEQMRMNMPDEATVFIPMVFKLSSFIVFTPLESRIIGVYANGERVHSLSSIGSIVLENCQFYAEEGGQKCDKGFLELDEVGRNSVFEVVSVVKSKGISILSGNVINQNKISEGSMVRQKIDVRRRMALMRAHSATHLLNWALRRVGAARKQCGSSVDEDSLRFDYITDDCAGEGDVVSVLRARRIHALTGENARQSKRYGKEVLSFLMSENENVSAGRSTDLTREVRLRKILTFYDFLCY